jgi:hypothetical protein
VSSKTPPPELCFGGLTAAHSRVERGHGTELIRVELATPARGRPLVVRPLDKAAIVTDRDAPVAHAHDDSSSIGVVLRDRAVVLGARRT